MRSIVPVTNVSRIMLGLARQGTRIGKHIQHIIFPSASSRLVMNLEAPLMSTIATDSALVSQKKKKNYI